MAPEIFKYIVKTFLPGIEYLVEPVLGKTTLLFSDSQLKGRFLNDPQNQLNNWSLETFCLPETDHIPLLNTFTIANKDPVKFVSELKFDRPYNVMIYADLRNYDQTDSLIEAIKQKPFNHCIITQRK